MTEISLVAGRRRRPTGRPRLTTTSALSVLVFLATGCGGGGEAKKVVLGGPPSSPETTTALDATTTSPPATASSAAAPTTRPSASGPGTTAAGRGTDPPPPHPPVTGIIPPPPTVRAVNQYLPPGFVDIVSPPQTDAGEFLRDGRCSDLLRDIAASWKPSNGDPAVPDQDLFLYRAAGEACLSQWVPAERDFQQVKPPPAFATETCTFERDKAACLAARTLVRDWTAGLLASHRANPAFVPNFPFAPK